MHCVANPCILWQLKKVWIVHISSSWGCSNSSVMVQWKGGTPPVSGFVSALTWTVCKQPIIRCPGEKGLEERQREVTPADPLLCLLSTITVNWVLRPPTSPSPRLPLLPLSPSSLLPFSVLSLFFFFPRVWPFFSPLRCHHGNPSLCCRTPPSPSLLVFLLPPSLSLSLSPIICSDSTVLNIDGGVLHPDPALLSSSSPFFLCLPLVHFLLCFTCVLSWLSTFCALPLLSSILPASFIPIVPILNSLLKLFCKCRRGDTTWLQLTPHRAGGFPFAHSQQAAFALVESISTMLLFSRPLPRSVSVFPLFFCNAPLFLSPTFTLSHPFSLCLSLPMSLWASPGLVAVGSTRASHTVTWHAIYRPSEGVALSARRMLS